VKRHANAFRLYQTAKHPRPNFFNRTADHYQNFLLDIGCLILPYIYGLSFQLVVQLSHLERRVKVIVPVLPIPSIRPSVTHKRVVYYQISVMCFSAGASFGASAVLGAIGIVTLKKAKAKNEIPFASIPLLFAVQQAAEGALWIGLSTGNESWKHFPVYIFLIFAQLVWPVWIPFSILQFENDRRRATLIKGMLGVGSCISLYLLYCMLVYDVKAELHTGHILYTLSFPAAFIWITNVFYFVPTVVPLFISSIKRIQLLGLAVLASFVFSRIYFAEHLISVWCFFAGILSIVVVWIVSTLKKQFHNHSGMCIL
jgi:hypothetical protein